MATLSQQDDTLFLSGALNFGTVMRVLPQGIAIFATVKQATISLRNVVYTDSAGIALLIEWKRFCVAQSCELRFTDLPDQFQTYLQLTGMTKVIMTEN